MSFVLANGTQILHLQLVGQSNVDIRVEFAGRIG
jgi:hypothetical protein